MWSSDGKLWLKTDGGEPNRFTYQHSWTDEEASGTTLQSWVYGVLTLPVTGEESEDQGHDWLSWPWWACLSAMAEGVAAGPGCFSGCHNNVDATRKQPGMSTKV